jgi:predicted permease
MLNQLLLRPLPGVADTGRSAFLEFSTPDQRNTGISGPLAEEIGESATLLEGVAGFDFIGVHVSRPDSRPLDVRAYTIFGDYFEILGVVPEAGRLLRAQETGPQQDPFVAVISQGLSEQLFARNDRVIGQLIHVNGHTFRILGVAGAGFRGTDRSWPVDLWVPRSAFSPLTGYPQDRLWGRDSRMNQEFLVRLRSTAEFETAEAELNSLLDRLAAREQSTSDYVSRLDATLHPGLNVTVDLRPYVRRALAILSAAGILILLIPCANVANLLLMRAVRLRGDAAVRRALGASAGGVARLFMAESLLLSVAGTAAGLGVAWIIGRALEGQAVWGLQAFEGFVMDWRLLAFACTALFLTAFLSGVLPAGLAGRSDPAAAMKDASHQHTARHGVLRHTMSAVQIALSLTLLVGSALLVRTVRNVYAVDPGLSMDGVYVASVHTGREPLDEAVFAALRHRILDAVRTLPDVRATSLQSFYGPYAGSLSNRISLPGSPDDGAQISAHWVDQGWFELLNINVLAGRSFRMADADVSAPKPVILTANLANRMFGSPTAALDRSVLIGLREKEEALVVGVVEDVRLTDVRKPAAEAVFLPYPGQQEPITVLVQATSESAGTAERLHRALESAAPAFPVTEPKPLKSRIENQIAEQRVLARLLGIFSGLAVLLAAVGLYSVISFGVSARRREFAIRVVLGADRLRIVQLVVRSATLLIVGGTALGLAGAFALSRLLESRLFGVEAVDPLSYVAAATGLALIAFAASWLPARAATRDDAAATLKSE